jgi:hypothetical protein
MAVKATTAGQHQLFCEKNPYSFEINSQSRLVQILCSFNPKAVGI